MAASFAVGRLSLAKVRLLVALVDGTEVLRAAFADAEAELVRHAERLSVRDTAYVVNHFAAHADPDGHEAEWEQMYENNRFHLAESLDGCGHLDGFFDPESTQIARHALGVIEDRLYRNEHANRGTDDDQPTLTPTQRRAAGVRHPLPIGARRRPGPRRQPRRRRPPRHHRHPRHHHHACRRPTVNP